MRDYEKERKWEAEKYKRLVYKCNVDLWDRFEAALEERGLSYSEWLLEHIREEVIRSGRTIVM